jgi:hypothetical protein
MGVWVISLISKMRLFAMSEGGKGLKNRFTRQIVNIFDFLKKQ